MKRSPVVLRAALAAAALMGLTQGARAEEGLGPIRVDQWGFFQRNPNGSDQWQYRPRLYVPWSLANGWTVTQRADLPMIYTDDKGSANPAGGFSGGIGNAFLETMLDAPATTPGLVWRAILRLTFPSPKGSPFGKDDQYQVAAGLGLSYRLAEVWNGITLEPIMRYNWGARPNPPTTQLVSSLDLYPAVTFGLGEGWSLALYPENPITYNRNNGQWFMPLDLMVLHRVNRDFEFGIGAAVKLGNPANPSYDYVIDGRATFYF